MRSIAGLQNRPTWGTGQRKSLTRRTPSGVESAQTTRQAHSAEQPTDENRISRDSLQEDEETLALAKKGSLKKWKRRRPCATCYSPCCSRWEWQGDRKSTRLNSSHSSISYAVFCLKKKNN